MGLIKIAALGALGYALYRYVQHEQALTEPAAFAPGEATGGHEVRNAGPQGMRSDPADWDEVDEASDESFPASDPPGGARFT